MDDKIRVIQRDPNLTPKEKQVKIQEYFLEKNKQNMLKVQKVKCEHYIRNCSIIAKCCGKEYGCRLCHDDYEDHKINRFETEEIICNACKIKQPVSNECTNCKIKFGEYFCDICRLWRDATTIYHCDKCGICLVIAKENAVHCDNCKTCYNKSGYESHICKSAIVNDICGICHENVYHSVLGVMYLKCGHAIHGKCMQEYIQAGNYKCPLCKKSVENINWLPLENLISQQPMPDEYKKKVNLVCNDCEKKTTEADYHFIGCKCGHCGSYNTALS